MFLKNTYYNYYFYDLNGKLTWNATPRDRFSLSLYQGADKGGYAQNQTYKYTFNSGDPENLHERSGTRKGELGIGWGSTVGALRWNHVFGSRLFSNTTLSFNRYKMVIDFATEDKGIQDLTPFLNASLASYRSGIMDLGVRFDFDWTPAPSHLVKFGAEYLHHDFRPETLTSFTQDINRKKRKDFLLGHKYPGHDTSLYIEDNITLGTHVSLNPGLRLSWFNTQGRNYLSAQPRLSAKASLGGGLAFKAGYSRMAQYVHLLSSTSFAMPLDLWVPITKEIRPVTSDQYTAGIYFDGLPGWEFSLEGYWKDMYNLLEYKEGVAFLGTSDGWEKQVEMGRGRSRGLELFVQKTGGKTTGWLSYTLAKSDRWFPDGSINMGRPFPYRYDRRHSVNLTLNHKFSDKVDVSASWVFMTGNYMTLPLRKTALLTPDSDNGQLNAADYVTNRNNYRLPPTHRLNLGVNLRHLTKRGNEVVWNFSLYNAYNAMNPQFIIYGIENDWGIEGDDDKLSLYKLTILPILPAFSYTLNF